MSYCSMYCISAEDETDEAQDLVCVRLGKLMKSNKVRNDLASVINPINVQW